LVGLVILAASVQAWAINKCTMPDGRVAYQEAPCSNDAKSSQQVDIATPSAGTGSSWEFSRQRDDMTGESTCFAVSPSVATGMRNVYSNAALVYVQLHGRPKSNQVYVTARTSTSDSEAFHHDLYGTGIKVDRQDFVSFSQRVSAHVLSFASTGAESAMVERLTQGQEMRLRLRFWPYDQLHDTNPITLRGFKQALKQLRACVE